MTEHLDMMREDVKDAPTAPAPGDVVALGSELQSLKVRLDALKADAKEVQAQYDEIRHNILPEAMQASGLVNDQGQGKFTLADGSTIYLASTVRAYVRKDDEAFFHGWLRGHGHADLLRESVHPQTLRAFVREQVENGGDLPDVVIESHETSARIRKGR